MGTLTTLPSELQIHIFGYLSRRDLKTVRLVCKTCEVNASPGLFKSVVACTRYHALGALKKISIHSILPNYVKELWFDGTVYFQAVNDTEGLYRYLEEKYLPDSPGYDFQRSNRWRRYRELYVDQEVIRKSMILLHEVSRAVDLLPNLHTVIYSPRPLQIPIEAKLMRNILPRGIVSSHHPNSWRDFIESCQHGLHHLLGALHQSKYIGIREFKILGPSERHDTTNRHDGNTVLSIDAFDMDSGFTEAALFFFIQLEKIDMSISLIPPAGLMGNHVGNGPLQLASLGALLALATKTRELCLRFYPWARSSASTYGHLMDSRQPLLLSLGLDTCTWSYLRSLTLEGIYAEETQLTGTMNRHMETLTKLQFDYCSLVSGTWASIVDLVLSRVEIVRFSIYRVNETMVHGIPFATLGNDALSLHQYEGELGVTGDGGRCFDEPIDTIHTSVYSTRY